MRIVSTAIVVATFLGFISLQLLGVRDILCTLNFIFPKQSTTKRITPS